MKTTRRDFLKYVAAGTCGAMVHNVLAPARGMLAFADPLKSADANTILIIVNLSGGCSYNIAPIYDGAYRDKNPTISYGPENSLVLNGQYAGSYTDMQGLHPALTGLKTIFDEGNLALMNLVGYPNPNRSHDEATDIWQSAMVRGGMASMGGWGARATCQMASTFAGISLSGANTFVRGDCNPPRSMESLDSIGEDNFWGDTSANKWLRDTRLNMMLDAGPERTASEKYVRDSNLKFQATADELRKFANTTPPGGAFPNTGFGNRCRDVARVIQSPLGARLFYLQVGGYDTHSGERAQLQQNLAELNGGLTALSNSIKAMGKWNNTIIITMSEFCRTHENGSQGTDHGHACPIIAFGGKVNGGIKNPPPDAATTNSSGEFYRGHDLDFRQIFFEAAQAMALNPDPIFPQPFVHKPIGLFKA